MGVKPEHSGQRGGTALKQVPRKQTGMKLLRVHQTTPHAPAERYSAPYPGKESPNRDSYTSEGAVLDGMIADCCFQAKRCCFRHDL